MAEGLRHFRGESLRAFSRHRQDIGLRQPAPERPHGLWDAASIFLTVQLLKHDFNGRRYGVGHPSIIFSVFPLPCFFLCIFSFGSSLPGLTAAGPVYEVPGILRAGLLCS